MILNTNGSTFLIQVIFGLFWAFFLRLKSCTMVNATQMAKNFGKRPNDWFNLPSTKSFLGVLSDTRKSCNAEFQAVRVVKGGINGGGATWMHEDVALEFARWLSPAFAIWCNDRIKELLTTGSTSIQKNLPQNYVEALRELAPQSSDYKVYLVCWLVVGRFAGCCRNQVLANTHTQQQLCMNFVG